MNRAESNYFSPHYAANITERLPGLADSQNNNVRKLNLTQGTESLVAVQYITQSYAQYEPQNIISIWLDKGEKVSHRGPNFKHMIFYTNWNSQLKSHCQDFITQTHQILPTIFHKTTVIYTSNLAVAPQ